MSFFRVERSVKCWIFPLIIGSTGFTSCDWDENWDKRKASQTRSVHRIILIRHGQYVSGKTDSERKLTGLGRQQAEATGKRLQKLLQDDSKEFPEIRNIYYSTMSRATETAQLMLPYIANDKTKVEPCSMIREGACYRPVPPISAKRWPVTDEDFYVDGKRIEAGFCAHVHRPDEADTVNESKSDTKSENERQGNPYKSQSKGGSYSTVLVCHGNVIRYFVARALQVNPEIWLRMAVNNAGYTILDVHSDGHVSLRTLGNDGHFSPEMITYM